MKITQEEVVDHQAVLHIELEDEDLDPYLDRGYRRVVQRTVIPGFRKGKAPRWRVERAVGRESLIEEVIDTLIPEVTTKAIADQELDAGSLPRIELLKLDPLTLKATVPLTPEIDIGPYREISIAEEPAEVTADDVEKHLDQLRHNMAAWEPVERPVDMGDMVTMEAVGTVEDRTVLDERGAVFFLDEDAKRPFPGFSQHLVGLVKDEPTKFTMAVPEDFSDAALAGKEASFSVTVSEIKERVLPEVNDEFAKSVGDGYDSWDALREVVEREVNAESEARAAQQYRDSVVSALVQSASVELPPLMVENEIDHMQEDRSRVLDSVNVRMDDYLRSIGKTADEARDDLREEAVLRLKRSLALSKVAEVEGVEISDEEVDERVQSILSDSADRSGRRPASEDLVGSVRRMLLADKTLEKLVAISKGEDEFESKPVEGTDSSEETITGGGDAGDIQA